MFSRYAIYLTPEGPLADAGAAWLGWDIGSGTVCAQPAVDGLDLTALTQRPRTYGFHGTIKAPFALAQGRNEDDLRRSFRRFCEAQAPVHLDALEVRRLGRFLALTPVAEHSDLRDLAAACVQQLDGFRAPLTADQLARRRKAHLTPAQDALLLKWGYPHVMEAFQFHMTLTGPVPRAQLAMVQAATAAYFAPYLPRPFMIDTLTLVGERADGYFVQIERATLGRAAA